MQDAANMHSSGAPEPEGSGALRLGPFHVSTAFADIEAFRCETGWPADDRSTEDRTKSIQVPHTFPMRWLTVPELWRVLEIKLKEAGGIAVHESQSFTYETSLDADQDYLMTADIDHQMNPERLIVRTSVVTARDEPCLRMETILRIISAAGSAP
jgi:hypothetical protein